MAGNIAFEKKAKSSDDNMRKKKKHGFFGMTPLLDTFILEFT